MHNEISDYLRMIDDADNAHSPTSRAVYADALILAIRDYFTDDELIELAQAKAEGRLVVLPCKVGSTVYEPFAGKVYEKTVDRIIINRFTTPQIWIETKLPFAASRLERWDMAFGKTVFLSKEAAEKALGGGEDNYPCTDYDCYDRGNYHTGCEDCAKHKGVPRDETNPV